MSVGGYVERAPYAVDPARSRGRLYAEEESAHRSPLQRDRDRILHSAGFRRLKHKTQVFVEHEGDYFRTRLTHSLEVAQIGRTMARALGLDEDLAEAVSLAHDLGHPPFGHAGESRLNDLMKPYGGFDHNGQALRVVTELEARYASFDGLNLTWETLEGLIKHNGPLDPRRLPYGVADYLSRHDLEIETHASAEAQIAAISDDIAYNNHDLDDGLRAGLFRFEEIRELAMVRPWAEEAAKLYPDAPVDRFRYETLRRVFGAMVEDVLRESHRRLEEAAPDSPEALRLAGRPLIGFSDAMLDKLNPLRRFLFTRMYRHPSVNRMMSKAKRVLSDMFTLLMDEPDLLPDEWRSGAKGCQGADRARIVGDYIAGMTDRYALKEHRALFDPHIRT